MIKQIVCDQAAFTTPEMKGYAALPKKAPPFLSRHYLIATTRQVELENVKIECPFAGVNVDVLAAVKDIPLAIYVTYPGREAPLELRIPSSGFAGVLEIDARVLPDYFSSALGPERSYKGALARYMETETMGKSWLCHPRQERASALVLAELEKEWEAARHAFRKSNEGARVQIPMSDVGQAETSPFWLENNLKIFHCQSCGANWSGCLPRDNSCKRCRTHLYVSVRDSSDET